MYRRRSVSRLRVFAFLAAFALSAPAAANGGPPGGNEPAAPKNFFVQSRGYGTRPEAEPPGYVWRLSDTGIDSLAEVDWLLFGADHRTRFEYRDDDYRRDLLTDRPFLLRTRAYAGIERVLDPVRLGVEFQDSRFENSEFPDNTRDVDEQEILQAFGELYGDDLLGEGRPVRVQVGRLAFEYLDRRLISRNPWRNTTNTFQGFRLMLGSKTGDWWVDGLGVQPVEIRPHQPNRRDKRRWFYGVIGSWQRWSEVVTIQPYVLALDESTPGTEPRAREIYTVGLRNYGVLGTPGFDYDVNLVGQVGTDDRRDVRAIATAAELGYVFAHSWQPRTSIFFGYASGDDDSEDEEVGHFDRLFGFARPWSASDYFIWENLIAPKTRVELRPTTDVRLEAGYGAYWLAAKEDEWPNAGRQDPTGRSGRFIGHEADARLRWQVDPHVEIVSGFSHFEPGGYTRRTGASPASDFLHVEVTLSLFGDSTRQAFGTLAKTPPRTR